MSCCVMHIQDLPDSVGDDFKSNYNNKNENH